MRLRILRLLPVLAVVCCAQQLSDWRRFSEGYEIPDESYSDQP